MEELVDLRRLLGLLQRRQHDPDGPGHLGIGHVQARHHQVLQRILLEGAEDVGGIFGPVASRRGIADGGRGIPPGPQVDVAVGVQDRPLGIGNLHPDGPVEIGDQVGIELEQVGDDPASLHGAEVVGTGRRPEEEAAEVVDGGIGKVEQVEGGSDGVETLDVGPGRGAVEGLGDEEGHEHGDELLPALESRMPPVLAHRGDGGLDPDGDGTARLEGEEGVVEQLGHLEGFVDDAVLPIGGAGGGRAALDQSAEVRFREEAARPHEEEGLRRGGVGLDVLGGDGAGTVNAAAGQDAGSEGGAAGALALALGLVVFAIRLCVFVVIHIHVIVVVVLVRRRRDVLLLLHHGPQRSGQAGEQAAGVLPAEPVRPDGRKEEGPLPGLGQGGAGVERIVIVVGVDIIIGTVGSGGVRFVVLAPAVPEEEADEGAGGPHVGGPVGAALDGREQGPAGLDLGLGLGLGMGAATATGGFSFRHGCLR